MPSYNMLRGLAYVDPGKKVTGLGGCCAHGVSGGTTWLNRATDPWRLVAPSFGLDMKLASAASDARRLNRTIATMHMGLVVIVEPGDDATHLREAWDREWVRLHPPTRPPEEIVVVAVADLKGADDAAWAESVPPNDDHATLDQVATPLALEGPEQG